MHPFGLANAFTRDPFAGNPAAAVFLEGANWPADHWMQGVAAQFNLAETAFILMRHNAGLGLRWMTPLAEVDLCGHATLAAAHLLWQTGRLEPGTEARFDTRSGALACLRQDDGRIAMDFPAMPVEPCPVDPEALKAFGLDRALGAWRDAGTDGPYLLVEAEDEDAVRGAIPDFAALRRLKPWGCMLTARASQGGDFVSRFFAPKKGVPEDPVTGSAHCRLGPWWGARLGKSSLEARQLSPRGGAVGMELRGRRLLLLGDAVTVGQGTLEI